LRIRKDKTESKHIHILRIDGTTVRVYNSKRISWHERNREK